MNQNGIKNKRIDFPVQREGKKPADENRFLLCHIVLCLASCLSFSLSMDFDRDNQFLFFCWSANTQGVKGNGQWMMSGRWVDGEWTIGYQDISRFFFFGFGAGPQTSNSIFFFLHFDSCFRLVVVWTDPAPRAECERATNTKRQEAYVLATSTSCPLVSCYSARDIPNTKKKKGQNGWEGGMGKSGKTMDCPSSLCVCVCASVWVCMQYASPQWQARERERKRERKEKQWERINDIHRCSARW